MAKNAGKNSNDEGQLKVQAVDDAAKESSSSTSTYEGVTADDFAAYSAMVEIRLDALVASSVVLVVALLFACGTIAVQTILRSLERW